jgi:hypothetical protein
MSVRLDEHYEQLRTVIFDFIEQNPLPHAIEASAERFNVEWNSTLVSTVLKSMVSSKLELFKAKSQPLSGRKIQTEFPAPITTLETYLLNFIVDVYQTLHMKLIKINRIPIIAEIEYIMFEKILTNDTSFGSEETGVVRKLLRSIFTAMKRKERLSSDEKSIIDAGFENTSPEFRKTLKSFLREIRFRLESIPDIINNLSASAISIYNRSIGNLIVIPCLGVFYSTNQAVNLIAKQYEDQCLSELPPHLKELVEEHQHPFRRFRSESKKLRRLDAIDIPSLVFFMCRDIEKALHLPVGYPMEEVFGHLLSFVNGGLILNETPYSDQLYDDLRGNVILTTTRWELTLRENATGNILSKGETYLDNSEREILGLTSDCISVFLKMFFSTVIDMKEVVEKDFERGIAAIVDYLNSDYYWQNQLEVLFQGYVIVSKKVYRRQMLCLDKRLDNYDLFKELVDASFREARTRIPLITNYIVNVMVKLVRIYKEAIRTMDEDQKPVLKNSKMLFRVITYTRGIIESKGFISTDIKNIEETLLGYISKMVRKELKKRAYLKHLEGFKKDYMREPLDFEFYDKSLETACIDCTLMTAAYISREKKARRKSAKKEQAKSSLNESAPKKLK